MQICSIDFKQLGCVAVVISPDTGVFTIAESQWTAFIYVLPRPCKDDKPVPRSKRLGEQLLGPLHVLVITLASVMRPCHQVTDVQQCMLVIYRILLMHLNA